jgi:hypothetical protein
MKRIKFYVVAGALLLVATLVTSLSPAIAAATPQSTVCSTLGAGSGCGSTPSNGINLNNLISAIVNILSVVVGVVAVFMIIVAGIRFVTSGGDSASVSGARNTIIYAIVGLAVVALSQFIVKFVLHRVTH